MLILVPLSELLPRESQNLHTMRALASANGAKTDIVYHFPIGVNRNVDAEEIIGEFKVAAAAASKRLLQKSEFFPCFKKV